LENSSYFSESIDKAVIFYQQTEMMATSDRSGLWFISRVFIMETFHQHQSPSNYSNTYIKQPLGDYWQLVTTCDVIWDNRLMEGQKEQTLIRCHAFCAAS